MNNIFEQWFWNEISVFYKSFMERRKESILGLFLFLDLSLTNIWRESSWDAKLSANEFFQSLYNALERVILFLFLHDLKSFINRWKAMKFFRNFITEMNVFIIKSSINTLFLKLLVQLLKLCLCSLLNILNDLLLKFIKIHSKVKVMIFDLFLCFWFSFNNLLNFLI